MTNFENDLILMVNKIEFRKNDINEIENSNKVLVNADKSRNIYKLGQDQYKKLAKTYEKSNKQKVKDINYAAMIIMQKLSVDRVELMQETETYISIKNHKDEFSNKIPCHLVNPSTSSIRKVRKVILNKINEKIVASTSVNQWRNMSTLPDWFNNIQD